MLIDKKTGREFVCAGQTIVFRVKATNIPENAILEFAGDTSIFTLDSLTEKFEWIEPRARGEDTIVESYNKLKQLYNKEIFLEVVSKRENEATFEIMYVIPYGTKQTLHSWNSLRQISNDAFNIMLYFYSCLDLSGLFTLYNFFHLCLFCCSSLLKST